MGNVIFMVDYIHGLPQAIEMGACMKGLMGLKGLNAGGCPLRLLYRPSAWISDPLSSLPREDIMSSFFFLSTKPFSDIIPVYNIIS